MANPYGMETRATSKARANVRPRAQGLAAPTKVVKKAVARPSVMAPAPVGQPAVNAPGLTGRPQMSPVVNKGVGWSGLPPGVPAMNMANPYSGGLYGKTRAPWPNPDPPEPTDPGRQDPPPNDPPPTPPKGDPNKPPPVENPWRNKYPGHGKYIQTPQQQEIWEKWGRTMLGKIFGTEGNPMDPSKLYNIPELNYNVPKYKGVDINQYIPSGQVYKNVENKIAPSLWQSYDRNVQNPMISRFASGGQLGNPSAGLSGAAADVLEANRRQAGNDISAQAYNLAQNPLMKAFDANTQGRQLQYGIEADKARQQALLPWQAELERSQYPYKLIPGMLNMSQQTPIFEQDAPKSGKC